MEFEGVIKTYEKAIKKYRFIYTLLEFLIITLIVYTIFFLLNIDQVFKIIPFIEIYSGRTYYLADFGVLFDTLAMFITALILSFLITLSIHLKRKKGTTIDLIEAKSTLVRERLRTAYDNRDKENIIVTDLIRGLVEDLTGYTEDIPDKSTKKSSQVKPSDMFDSKRFKLTVLLLLASTSAFVYLTSTDTRTDFMPENLIEYSPFIPGITDPSDTVHFRDETDDVSDPVQVDEKPTLVVVDGEEIDLSIPPGADAGFAREEEGEPQVYDFSPSSAYDVGVMASPTYYEELPQGYEDIIKRYFEEMAET
ncbi:hypothetical protein D5R95_04780 [Methanosalsum natronophilum]|uniref:Uncharacterized protein n=1 Tax=Methanosalsum natronophilum TaxID=768733 RepID=A0A424YXX2_9EURY|nr:MAG: hypothetical protein D5R95_04780 [Methanosalsum natronophilum]